MAEEELISSADEELFPPVPKRATPEYSNLMGTLAGVATTPFIGTKDGLDLDFLDRARGLIAQIEQGLEDDIRIRIANQRKASELEAMTSLIQDEVLSAGPDMELLQGALALEEAGQRELDQNALEKEAVDRLEEYGLLSETNQGVAELLLIQEERGTAFDELKDQLERTLIMTRHAEQIETQLTDMNWARKVGHYIASVIPLSMFTAAGELPGGVGGWMAGSGENILAASRTLRTVSRKEFDEMVPKVYKAIKDDSGWIGENLAIQSHIAERLISINTPQAALLNAIDFIDAVLLPFDIQGIAALSRIGKAAVARRARARELSVSVTVRSLTEAVDDATKAAKEISTDVALDEAQASATKVTDPIEAIGDVSVSAAVTAELKFQERIIEKIAEESAHTGRVSDEVMERIQKEAVEELQTEMGNVVDFKVFQEKGQVFVSTLLGKRGGAIGFSRAQDAKGAATRMGILDHEVIQAIDGQFFIKTKFGVSDAKYMVINEAKATQSGPLSTFLRSAANIQDEFLQNRATQAGMKASRYRALIKPMMANFRLINKKSKQAVQAVWERGNVDKRWFSDNEFASVFNSMNSRLPTEGELLAYRTLKNINDADHFFFNHSLYAKRFNEGFITGRLEGPEFSILPTNVKRIENVGETNYMTVYDATRNEVIEGVDLPRHLADQMDKGDELFELGKAIDTPDGVVKYVLGRKGAMKTSPLRYQQLPYVEGGHRIYDGKYFVKVAVTDTLKSGATSILNPKTFAVTKTKAEAVEWADRWNEMIDAYRLHVKDPTNTDNFKALEDSLNKNGFEGTVDEFAKVVSREKLDSRHRLEVTFNREEPSAYATLRGGEGTVYDQTFAIAPHESWLETTGKLYYGRRGKALKGPQDERAAFLDPFKTAQKAVEASIHNAAFTDYRIAAINNWMNTYSKYLPKNGKSNETNFFSDIKLEGGDQFVQQRAQQVRELVKRQLGTQTVMQGAMNVGIRRFAEWIEAPAARIIGDKSLKIGETTLDKSTAAKFVFDVGSRHPITAMKSLAFDLKLGLFDPSQFIIQTQTAAAMAFVDPAGFAKFGMDLIPIRWALRNGTDEVGSILGKMTSMDKAEFKSFMSILNESGAMNVGNELVYFERAALEPISQGAGAVSRLREWGRFPFYESERINRIAAFRIAWNKMREGGVSLEKMATSDNRAKLAGMTDKYSMNMTQASAAAWQKGGLSAATQFLSYNARFIENVLPFLGSKRWTGPEKARLALSQAVLYGVAGVPMGEYITSRLSAGDPEVAEAAQNNPTAYRAVTGGIINAGLYAISGGELDIDITGRMAIWQGAKDMFFKLNGEDYQSSSFLEVLGGAPVSVALELGSDILSAGHMIMAAAHSERVALSDVTPEIFQGLIDNVSSLSRASRMYYALKYGNYYSLRTGKVLVGNITTPEAFALGLGIQPREMVDMGLSFDMLKARQETIKSLAAPIAKIRKQAFMAYGRGDKEEADRLLNIASAMLSPLEGRDRGEVAKRAMGKVELESLFKSMQIDLRKEGLTLPNLEGTE